MHSSARTWRAWGNLQVQLTLRCLLTDNRTLCPHTGLLQAVVQDLLNASKGSTKHAGKPTLHENETLNDGQSLVSPNGTYRMTMQGDGNLVLYRGSHPLWASGTDGRGPGCHAVLHEDNLFAVYY